MQSGNNHRVSIFETSSVVQEAEMLNVSRRSWDVNGNVSVFSLQHLGLCIIHLVYIQCQSESKKSPEVFWHFFPNGLEFLV